MRFYLLTDDENRFIALCKREEDIEDIKEPTDNVTEINIEDIWRCGMTERFWYDFEDCTGAKIVDFKENKEYPLETIGDFRKIEKLLNEQHEQIERLKRNFKALEEVKCELAEENEQLKNKLNKGL